MKTDVERQLKAFLLWMNENKIDSVIPFFAYQDGRNGKIPHWTDGKRLYDASELIEKYLMGNLPKDYMSRMKVAAEITKKSSKH